MARLAPHPLPADVHPATPDLAYARVNLDDPATTVMTDLRRYRAVTIRGQETLAAAERLMIDAGVRLLLVINAAGAIIGVATYRDLTGERSLAAAAHERIAHADLAVALVMTPADKVKTLDYRAVTHTPVRDLIEFLRTEGRQHALVTETDESGRPVVRGIFSITQVGRLLGIPIEADERAQSFAEIEHLLAHG
ncbi:MAG: CBS domain-containing protein [Gammaproteobacteria bacterium]